VVNARAGTRYLLLLVLERGALEVGDDVRNGALDELDFVGDGATLSDRGGGFGLTVAIGVGYGSGGGWRGRGGLLSLETFDILLGFGDVLLLMLAA